jgi:hypothetical protein
MQPSADRSNKVLDLSFIVSVNRQIDINMARLLFL